MEDLRRSLAGPLNRFVELPFRCEGALIHGATRQGPLPKRPLSGTVTHRSRHEAPTLVHYIGLPDVPPRVDVERRGSTATTLDEDGCSGEACEQQSALLFRGGSFGGERSNEEGQSKSLTLLRRPKNPPRAGFSLPSNL